MRADLALVGFGHVGQRFARLIAEQADALRTSHGLEPRIVGIATRRHGSVYAEEGIDIAAEQPKLLTNDTVKVSDVVITKGCGDTCPYYPGKRYEDWTLDDPAGQGIAVVRPIRNQIRRRVEQLIRELQN